MKKVLVIDLERCLGCGACKVACKVEKGSAQLPGISVETSGGRQDSPTGRYPDLKMEFLPRLCIHCQIPGCVEACPSGAVEQREDGLVLLDKDKCNGCGVCVSACPHGAIIYDEAAGQVVKCDLCASRIDQGLEPFCVVCCEGQAMHFGDLDDRTSEVSRMLARRRPHIAVPEAAACLVFYCPAKKRRPL